MDRNIGRLAGGPWPDDVWRFAQDVLGKPVRSAGQAAADARAKAMAERERLKWLAGISPRHEEELRELRSADADARRERELLTWAAQISPEHEAQLRALLREEAEAGVAQDRDELFYNADSERISEWNEVDHPRRGQGPHPGAWVKKGEPIEASAR
jgi:hypothetical protein